MVVQQITLGSFYLTLHHNHLRSPKGLSAASLQTHFFREAHTEVSVYAVHYCHVLSWPKESSRGR